jgi:nucleoside transporter
MNTTVRLQLSIMMFIQFFIWGAWYVTGPSYLGTIGFQGKDFGWMYSVGPIAGMISPFFVGMVADRFFAGQRVLAALHLAGACLMFLAVFMMKGGASPGLINLVFFLYMLTYFPTLALTNTIAMRNMNNPETQFPGIRVLGTIGWIAAGITLSWLGWSTQVNMFYLVVGAAALLAVFSLLLPHTPPTATGKVSVREVVGLDALVLLKDRGYLVFIICSMLICIPLAFYYQIAARMVEMLAFDTVGGFTEIAQRLKLGDAIGLVMSFGQMSEIIFMLIMPFFFVRLGVKWMLAVGMLAWVSRYLLFSLGAPEEVRWMVLLGILLHGICYDFFFVTGQIYTDQKSPRHLRGQAQGLLVLFTLGLGMLIGAQIAGQIVEPKYTPSPAQLAARANDPAQVEHLTARFESREEAEKTLREWRELAAIGLQLEQLSAQLEKTPTGDAAARTAVDTQIQSLMDQKATMRRSELRAIDWKPLWGIPAAFAAVIMVIFLVLFRDGHARMTKGELTVEPVPQSAPTRDRPV